MITDNPLNHVERETLPGQIVGYRVHADDCTIMQASLRQQTHHDGKAAIYVDYTDPLTLLNFAGQEQRHQAVAIFCHTLYELLCQQDTAPDVMLPSLVAVQFDGAMRNMMLYECGEKPVFTGKYPDHDYYRYKKPVR